jgi:hypothetical protein
VSLIRPEAEAVIRRWIETVSLAAIAILFLVKGGEWLGQGDWIGLVLLVVGGLFGLGAIFAGLRSALRQRGVKEGPGVLAVEEGRISYFGPEGGGVLAIDLLTAVDIVTNDLGPFADDLYWVLTDEYGQRLSIPGGAVDADKLLDALNILEGIDYTAIVRAMGSTEKQRFAIWRRPDNRRLTST